MIGMGVKLRYKVILIVIVSLCACQTDKNQFADSFKKSAYYVKSVGPTESVNVVETENIAGERNDWIRKGYTELGGSDHYDKLRSMDKAIEFAKSIDATDILYNREYMGERYTGKTQNVRRQTTAGVMTSEGYTANSTTVKLSEKEKYYRYRVHYFNKGE